MITGIGTDIVDLARIEALIAKKEIMFYERYFTMAEKQFFVTKKNAAASVAGNFAAKEAFAKALGTGIRGFLLKEIGIARDIQGKPYFEQTKVFERLKRENGFHRAFVTISHAGEYAVATVVLEKDS